MFASVVSTDRCDLFRVVRTDLHNWDRIVLTYPATDYQTAVRRAAYFQQFWGQAGRYDYRVCNAD